MATRHAVSAPVVVEVSDAGPKHGTYRISFARAGQARSRVVFTCIAEVAMAVNLAGGAVDEDMGADDPHGAAELVMSAVKRYGASHIRLLAAADCHINGEAIRGRAHPEHQRDQSAMWSRRRAQDCTSVAYRLSFAAERGVFSLPVPMPAPRAGTPTSPGGLPQQASRPARRDASDRAVRDGSPVLVGGAR